MKKSLCLAIFFLYFSELVFAKEKVLLVNTNANISVFSETNGLFTLDINLNIKGDYPKWGIGFFWFHVLVKQNNLQKIEICEKNNSHNCSKLAIKQKPPMNNIKEFLRPDLSLGHVTLIEPIKKFNLSNNKTYVIKISGLQNTPQNISAMPQSLFIYLPSTFKILESDITVNSYASRDYDSSIVESQMNQEIYDKWAEADKVDIDSPIVPLPRKTIYKTTLIKPSVYDLDGKFKVYLADKSLRNYLLNNSKKIKWIFVNRAEKANIKFLTCSKKDIICNDIQNQPEGYVLDITDSGLRLYANNTIGHFYGLQTLLQLYGYHYNTYPRHIYLQTIIDYPRFKYRGIMLDTVRHFFTVDELKLLINVMATHKLNTLRLHLADDEGWRVQIPNYPKLIKIGSIRGFGRIIGPSNLIDDRFDITNLSKQSYEKVDTKYSGFYSVKEIKSLIRYANLRQITLIPEIEMPSHARAMKKAMPHVFFDSRDKSEYYSVQGYNDNVLPICKYGQGNEFAQTTNNIIMEIAKLFGNQTTRYFVPNEVSLSGDELPENALNNYHLCKTGVWNNLTTIERSHLFFNQLSNKLPQYKLSGYQQLVQDDDGKISKKAVNPAKVGHIWAWIPTSNHPVNGKIMANNLIGNGYKTVLAFADYMYFDIRYTEKWDEPGLYWSKEKSGTHQVMNSGNIAAEIGNSENLLGLEGVIWSELIPSKEHLWYMTLPKMSALAEASWTPNSDVNWYSFTSRMGCGTDGFLKYLSDTYQVKYRGYPNGIRLEIPDGACSTQ